MPGDSAERQPDRAHRRYGSRARRLLASRGSRRPAADRELRRLVYPHPAKAGGIYGYGRVWRHDAPRGRRERRGRRVFQAWRRQYRRLQDGPRQRLERRLLRIGAADSSPAVAVAEAERYQYSPGRRAGPGLAPRPGKSSQERILCPAACPRHPTHGTGELRYGLAHPQHIREAALGRRRLGVRRAAHISGHEKR